MKVDPEGFLLLAAAIAGCHQAAMEPGPKASSASAAASASVATIEVPPAPAPHAAAPPASTSCEALALQNDAVLTKIGGSCAGFESDEPRVRSEMAKTLRDGFFRYCHRGKGTWAVVLLSATVDAPTGEAGGCGWSAAYKLVYQADPSAKIADGAQTKALPWSAFPDDTTSAISQTPFDYDGDGHDELIVVSSDWQNGGGGTTAIDVLQSVGSEVSQYKVPFPFDGMGDVDGDGRPDLIDKHYFRAPTYCGLSPEDEIGASALLHSLPDGTFSRTDETARRWAITQCPTADFGGSDCGLGATCRRLWGRSTKQVTAWMASAPACKDQDTCSGAGTATGASVGATPERVSGFAVPPPPVAPLNHATPVPLPQPMPAPSISTD